MIIGKNDEMEHCAPDIQHAVFELIPANKRLCQIDKGHFGLLDPLSSEFEKSATVQVNVLREILACNQHHASSTIQKLCCPHSETFGERLMRGSISVMAQPPVPYDAYEKADMVFAPMRHLPLLAQKVGAVDQAVPLKGWDLPDEFATRHCQPAGKRDYVQILHLGFLPIWVAMIGKLVRNHEK
ncbi:hypothetical protein [Parasedimentitalea psychrophila]|uniref:Uncharacterized protein n=1 Tax=Parasedimentitalea psychrophila TaxID=2997337 RepID=A0A9Y2P4E8_9RHOB|nr:hypothetical protein [Parasedimentitalea psychrophila]WIY25244.1 hypothetical protein QPJ95_22645 [Parasedimentitalea psychrophila]